MARYIKNYCPICGHETTHKIWKEDFLGGSGLGRIVLGICTAEFSMWDSITYCECCSCGRTKRKYSCT